MNKKWVFGNLFVSSFMAAALVACGSGDIIEVGDDDEVLLMEVGKNVVEPNIAVAEQAYEAYISCQAKAAAAEGSYVEPLSSSSAEIGGEVSGGVALVSSSSVVTPVVTESSSSIETPIVTQSSSSSVVTPIVTQSSSSSVVTPVVTQSSSSEAVLSSSSETSSGSSIVADSEGNISNFTPSSTAILEEGTYTIATCNSKSGSLSLQISSTGANCWDFFETVGGSQYWQNSDGLCIGQATVTFPVTITIPSGKQLTIENGCW